MNWLDRVLARCAAHFQRRQEELMARQLQRRLQTHIPKPVKKAARKPSMSDRLLLEQGKATITTEEGRTIERTETQFLDMLRKELLPPTNGVALPDGLKFAEWRPPHLLVVHQYPWHIRQFRWIANDSPKRFGPGTTYRKVRLSIPYSITFALFTEHGGRLCITGSNELYFRNEPLRAKSDKLCFPALLNISRINSAKRQRSWICTQYLRHPKAGDWTAQLSALLDHTWNGGFNLSSEHHEGASWYGESKGIHAALHPVEKWEEASAADEAFALRVNWKPCPMTVGELIDCILEECRGGQPALAAAAAQKTSNLIGRFINYKP